MPKKKSLPVVICYHKNTTQDCTIPMGNSRKQSYLEIHASVQVLLSSGTWKTFSTAEVSMHRLLLVPRGQMFASGLSFSLLWPIDALQGVWTVNLNLRSESCNKFRAYAVINALCNNALISLLIFCVNCIFHLFQPVTIELASLVSFTYKGSKTKFLHFHKEKKIL